jgi:hypothetical protein
MGPLLAPLQRCGIAHTQPEGERMRLVVGLSVLLAATLPARAEVLLAFQDWKLVATSNPVTEVVDYFIGTTTSDGNSAFGLECRHAVRSYAFFVDDPSFNGIKLGQKLALDFRLVNGKPDKLLAASVGTGRFIIEEHLQNPSFNYLLMSIYGAETGIGFSGGSKAFLFSLRGFSKAADALGKTCGFTPNEKPQR